MIREITREDLGGLMSLYAQLHAEPAPEDARRAREVLDAILCDPSHHIIAAEEQGSIVSSCVLVIIPNLTRGQRPYALVENVVTDAAHRRRGLASACLEYAREIASKENCYKIMLMTGSKDPATLRFYERAGYNSSDKTAFIRWL
ncbi:MAG: GNAT family N-acetyltransferase [Clostridiales bacterium]|jgi:GNAT superfamily N-acetyltransferase|nr:GNAT family N-acetyltransferase [Clostridiales bacterium]